MSRSYEMAIKVGGIKKEKFHAVMDFLEGEWFRDEALDIRHKFEFGFLDNSDGATVNFQIIQQLSLCGGETEDEFGERIYEGILEINEIDFSMELEATYLDDLPFETYYFGTATPEDE